MKNLFYCNYATKIVCMYYLGLQMRPNKENKNQDEVSIILLKIILIYVNMFVDI